MTCHKLNDTKFLTRWWHRLRCAECRNAQHLDTMIGFGLMQMKSEPFAIGGMENTLAALNMQEGGRGLRRASRRMAGRWLRYQVRNMGVALVVGAVWWQYMNYLPPMQIPVKRVPKQNAFDYFKAANSLISTDDNMKKQMEEAQQVASDPPTRERRDARLKREGKPIPPESQLLQQAALAEQQDALRTGIPVAPHDPSVKSVKKEGEKYDSKKFRMLYTLEEKQQILDDCKPMMAKLREGLQYPYMETYPYRFDALFPHYADFRQMARLLSLEAEIKAARGDWNGAMQDSLDAMQMGVDLAHGGPLIGRLVGIACEAIGQKNAWKAVGHLNAQEARAAIARLQTIRANHAPFVETMQEEKWFMLASLRDQMRKPNWRIDVTSLFGSDNKALSFALLGWSNRIILRDITIGADENIRRSRLPYAQSSKLPEIKAPFDPIAEIMFPVFAQAQYKDIYASETQSALLLTALALRAYSQDLGARYHIKGGVYPDTLTRLVPDYLPSLPNDPFSPTGGSLHYSYSPPILQLTGKEEANSLLFTPPYTLYSVGPDGKDDGGMPVDGRTKYDSRLGPQAGGQSAEKNKNRFIVLPDRLGDILAGINTH